MGVFAKAGENSGAAVSPARTFAGWREVLTSVSARLYRRESAVSRLAILERITVGPKQTVTLIEVEGEKVLVGTSQEGAPQFLRLKAARRRGGPEDRIRLQGTIG